MFIFIELDVREIIAYRNGNDFNCSSEYIYVFVEP